MNALLDYWPLLFLLLCFGMHLFGHGHRYGRRDGSQEEKRPS
jgi:hypothetical protein